MIVVHVVQTRNEHQTQIVSERTTWVQFGQISIEEQIDEPSKVESVENSSARCAVR